MKTTNVSARHIDTCLSCYLTDHHNRDGELLIGIEPRGQSLPEATREAWEEAWDIGFDKIPGHTCTGRGGPVWEALENALRGVDLKPIDETSPADDEDSSDRAQVWLLLEWESV